MLRASSKKALHWGAFLFLGALPVQAACPPPTNVKTVQVEKVFDGDTVRLHSGTSVRLIGVNTPEMRYDTGNPEPGAKEATDFLVQRAAQITQLQQGVDPRDRYGRTLAHLYFSSGKNVEEALLERGLGFFISIPPNTQLSGCLRQAENRARNALRGIWSGQRWPVAVQALPAGHTGFSLLYGEITKVSKGRRAWYVELDDRVVLRIDTKVLALFDDAERIRLRPKDRVEVRGWLVDRSGSKSVRKKGYKPLIINISHPDHLRFLAD